MLNYLNQDNKKIKKINLHKFVRENLPDYMIVNQSELVDSQDGVLQFEYILVKPNRFNKSKSLYILKINKKDSSVTIVPDPASRINLELDHVQRMINRSERRTHLQDKLNYNELDYSKIREVIETVFDIGVKHRFYKKIDLPFLENISNLSNQKSMEESMSTFLSYDILGGVSLDKKKKAGCFYIDKKSIMNEHIEIDECISMRFPLWGDQTVNIILVNNHGTEEIYTLYNDKYTKLNNEQELKNNIKSIFIEVSKDALYYKFDVKDQELSDQYITLLEMETI